MCAVITFQISSCTNSEIHGTFKYESFIQTDTISRLPVHSPFSATARRQQERVQRHLQSDPTHLHLKFRTLWVNLRWSAASIPIEPVLRLWNSKLNTRCILWMQVAYYKPPLFPLAALEHFPRRRWSDRLKWHWMWESDSMCIVKDLHNILVRQIEAIKDIKRMIYLAWVLAHMSGDVARIP